MTLTDRVAIALLALDAPDAARRILEKLRPDDDGRERSVGEPLDEKDE